MPSLRDEITNTFRRIHGRSSKAQTPDETVVATDPRIGKHYGAYRVLRRLGAGGMGHVYLALDTHLGRHVALKFLSPKLKSNPEMLVRLQQEARTASSLNHPNILTIYEIAEAGGEPFIASEFVDGVTLRQALEHGAVSPASVLDIAMQIVSALMPAHGAGIVHRDLKPGNVMLRPDGLVKVIDFGLAKFTAHGHVAPSYEPLSDPGEVAGTVQYMSPEQARGEIVDHRTDLWSMGVILYEMISLHKPFDGETESHVIVAILDHRPPALKGGAGIPAGLPRVAERALTKNREKRYQSAQEFLDALKALDPSSRPSRMPAPLLVKRTAWRDAPRWTWFGALMAVAAAGTAIWWWPVRGGDRVRDPSWFVPTHYTQVTHRGDVNIASLSPNGKHVAYTTTASGMDQLHLLNLEAHTEHTWPPYAGNTLGVTFSPDTSTVFYTVHDQHEWGRLYSVKEQAAESVFVLDDVDGPITFSPNGLEFAFHRRFDDKRTIREAIVVADTRDTGTQQMVLNKYNTSVGSRIAWARSGAMAVTVIRQNLQGQAQPTILLFTRDGKEMMQRSVPWLRRLSGPAWLNDGSMFIFAGSGPGDDPSQATIVELSMRTGGFRSFTAPLLAPNGLSVSTDYQQAVAISSSRKSTLWVADANRLDSPQQWSGEDPFESLAWNSEESIVHPTSIGGGTISLSEIRPTSPLRLLPHRDNCAVRQPAGVPNKRLLIFSSNCDATANSSDLWLLDERTGELAPLTNNSFSDQKPVASPDGDTILYNSWTNNTPALMKISLGTKSKSQFTPLNARNAAISPDGQHVVCQIRENYDGKWRVAVLSMLNANIERDNLPLPDQLNSIIRWSPDGMALDYVALNDSANIFRFSLNSSSAKPLTHLHGNAIDDFAWSANGSRLAWVSSENRRDVLVFHRGGN